MGSTNKTAELALSAWVGGDVPKMADFNADNALLDTAFAALRARVAVLEGGGEGSAGLGAHIADTGAHLSAQDRLSLDACRPVIGSYTGDGNPFQGVVVGFRPSFGFVFAAGLPPATTNAAGTAGFTHFAVVSNWGSMAGVETTTSGLRVLQLASGAQNGQTSLAMNMREQVYVYVLWQ